MAAKEGDLKIWNQVSHAISLPYPLQSVFYCWFRGKKSQKMRIDSADETIAEHICTRPNPHLHKAEEKFNLTLQQEFYT